MFPHKLSKVIKQVRVVSDGCWWILQVITVHDDDKDSDHGDNVDDKDNDDDKDNNEVITGGPRGT